MIKTREDQILDLARGELAAFRSVVEGHGVARVVITVDFDRKSDEPYDVHVGVERRRYTQPRTEPRSGFVVDRTRRVG